MNRLLLTGAILALTGAASAQTQVYQESFETNGNPARYTTTVPEFVGPTAPGTDNRDYFVRTELSTLSGADTGVITNRTALTGLDGTFFFGAQDIDGNTSGASPTLSLTLPAIDISTVTGNLQVRALYATAWEPVTGGSPNRLTWDGSDEVLLFATVDGGAEQRVLSIQSTASSNGETRVTADPASSTAVATDTELTPAFAEFTALVAGTGTTLTLRYQVTLNGGDEDIAIDNVRVFGLVTPVAGEEAPASGAALSVPTPNPARGAATLMLSAPAGEAHVVVIDALGRTVATLYAGAMPASGRLRLAASGLAPGIYVVRAAVGSDVLTRTLTVVR